MSKKKDKIINTFTEPNTLILNQPLNSLKVTGFNSDNEIVVTSKDELAENFYYLSVDEVKDLIVWMQAQVNRLDPRTEEDNIGNLI